MHFTLLLLVASGLPLAAQAGVLPTYTVATPPDPVELSSLRHERNVDGVQGVHKQTFVSSSMPLKHGEVVFTDPQLTQIQMPPGKIGITGFVAEVVDEQHKSVPLTEVYNHHWLIFDGKGNSGVCGGYLGYKFGVGAECRGTPTVFPEPYALVTDGTETWGANIHLLRTVDLANGDAGTRIASSVRTHPRKAATRASRAPLRAARAARFAPPTAGRAPPKITT